MAFFLYFYPLEAWASEMSLGKIWETTNQQSLALLLHLPINNDLAPSILVTWATIPDDRGYMLLPWFEGYVWVHVVTMIGRVCLGTCCYNDWKGMSGYILLPWFEGYVWVHVVTRIGRVCLGTCCYQDLKGMSGYMLLPGLEGYVWVHVVTRIWRVP